MKKLKHSPHAIKGYKNEVYALLEVGLSILAKGGGRGPGHGVGIQTSEPSFISLIQESFDMLLDQSTFLSRGPGFYRNPQLQGIPEPSGKS